MSKTLARTEPRFVWQAFEALSQIPRPSGHPGPVTAHIDAWAAAHGLAVRQDDYGNRVVVVPAQPGRENAPIVVLQAHLDMVGEQRPGTGHDFFADRIRIDRRVDADDEWLVADGTTLGADNGVGVALAMAAAIDPAIERGPLELLFTLDEEIGLRGAAALDPALVEGRRMINLDSEVDGSIFIGCAGAAGVEGTSPIERVDAPAGARPWRLVVDGLLGGHSGLEIDRHRGNAVSLLAHALLELGDATGLAAIDGGDKGNAIPRRAEAVLWLTPEATDRARRLVATVGDELAERFRSTDPGVELRLESMPAESEQPPPIEPARAIGLCRLLAALPTGVRSMSRAVPGLVQTSANLARVRTPTDEPHRVEWLVSMRSSSNAELAELGRSVVSIARLAGAETHRLAGYPGWAPDADSPLLAAAVEVYGRLYGEPPTIESVHAGLECGVLSDRLGGLDAISIGPEIRGAHSPDERVSIVSTARVYRWLVALLGDLAAEKW